MEESGSSLFSLFSLFWKNLEAYCFHYFHCCGRIWKLIVFVMFTVVEESGSLLYSLFSLLWKNLEAHCFHCFLTESASENSENISVVSTILSHDDGFNDWD